MVDFQRIPFKRFRVFCNKIPAAVVFFKRPGTANPVIPLFCTYPLSSAHRMNFCQFILGSGFCRHIPVQKNQRNYANQCQYCFSHVSSLQPDLTLHPPASFISAAHRIPDLLFERSMAESTCLLSGTFCVPLTGPSHGCLIRISSTAGFHRMPSFSTLSFHLYISSPHFPLNQ